MSDIIEALRSALAEQDAAKVLHIANEVVRQHDEGLIKVLPCKVGDTIYKPCNGLIHEGKILGIAISFNGSVCVRYEMPTYYSCDRTGEIGKTVFLTREEADKALKEREKQ